MPHHREGLVGVAEAETLVHAHEAISLGHVQHSNSVVPEGHGSSSSSSSSSSTAGAIVRNSSAPDDGKQLEASAPSLANTTPEAASGNTPAELQSSSASMARDADPGNSHGEAHGAPSRPLSASQTSADPEPWTVDPATAREQGSRPWTSSSTAAAPSHSVHDRSVLEHVEPVNHGRALHGGASRRYLAAQPARESM